ncbi:MAG: hypothetical protein WCF23_11675 [Candidatus Nitrosopolaris sp.]
MKDERFSYRLYQQRLDLFINTYVTSSNCIFANLVTRALLMTLVLLERKKVSITEYGTNKCLNTGSFAICCIDINPVPVDATYHLKVS